MNVIASRLNRLLTRLYSLALVVTMLPLFSSAQVYDPTFDAQLDAAPFAVAFQPDGQLLLGGLFYNTGGVYQLHAGRLRVDQTLDPTE